MKVVFIASIVAVAVSAIIYTPQSAPATAEASCSWGQVGSFPSGGWMDWGYGNCGEPDCYVASGDYDGTCYAQESNYWCGVYSYTCTADVCPAGQVGTYPNCHAPTCADNPGMDGCGCTKSNACNTTSGTLSGGNCNAPEPTACPAPSCSDYPGHIGTYPYCFTPSSCPASNSCGMTNWGTTVDYAGTCSASAPSEALCAPAPGPTCADSGQLGTYPNCYNDPGPGTPAAVVTLTANPTSITAGNSSTLTWSSTNATSCTGGGFSTGGSTGNSIPVSPAATANYTITCTGPGGSDTDSATVTVTSGGSCSGAGPLNATATPNRVNNNSTSITINWSGANVNAASCSLTNLGTGATVGNSTVTTCSTSGSATVPGITAQTTYRVTCGSLTKDVVVNVVPRFGEF